MDLSAGDSSFSSLMSSGSIFTTQQTHLIIQSELNDLIRDLNLSKQKAELLASRLQE